MTKMTAFIFCAVLAAGSVFLREVQHRSEIRILRAEIQTLEEGRDQLSHSELATPRLTNLTEETKGPEADHGESSRQILRLRNQVALLLKSNEQAEKLLQEKDKLIQILEQQKEEKRKDFEMASYSFYGIDTNSVPLVNRSDTKREIVAELIRVGAKVLTDQENFLHAETNPSQVAANSGESTWLSMEFYFDNGKLSSRKDRLKRHSAKNAP